MLDPAITTTTNFTRSTHIDGGPLTDGLPENNLASSTVFVIPLFVWSGAVDSDWGNPANWRDGLVPVAAGWELEPGWHSQSVGGDPRWVQVEGVDGYSPFVLNDVTPTAVTLSTFSANSDLTGCSKPVKFTAFVSNGELASYRP